MSREPRETTFDWPRSATSAARTTQQDRGDSILFGRARFGNRPSKAAFDWRGLKGNRETDSVRTLSASIASTSKWCKLAEPLTRSFLATLYRHSARSANRHSEVTKNPGSCQVDRAQGEIL